MRRAIIFVLILAMLLTLAACAEHRPDNTVPTNEPVRVEDPTGEVEDYVDEVPEESTEPDPMAAYVRTARQEVLTFHADAASPEVQTYRYPEVRLSSDDAETWNVLLARDMDVLFDRAVSDAENGAGTVYSSVDYQAWLWEDILMVMITMKLFGVENAEYRIGAFDLRTEEELDKGELFSLAAGQRTPASMNEVITLHLGAWFDQEHQDAAQDEFLAEQREKTLSPENVEQAWLYFDEAGELMAVVPAYTVAGTQTTTAFVPLTDFSPVEVNVPPAEDATLEELVSVYRSEHVAYTSLMGNEYDIIMTIPQVNIDTPAGRDCNWELRDELEIWMDEQIEAKEGGWSTHTGSIGYDAWIWENRLTLMAWHYTTVEYNDYFVYVFDLETGEQLTNEEVAQFWQVDDETWKAAAAAALEQTYREKYETYSEPDEFFHEQLTQTISEENILSSALYPTADGTPMMLCRIYAIAGAEYYWHLVPVALP